MIDATRGHLKEQGLFDGSFYVYFVLYCKPLKLLFSVSGAKLRCDVIVDEIYSIAIETTTHELYLDDSPEEFVIRAMNEEGEKCLLVNYI